MTDTDPGMLGARPLARRIAPKRREPLGLKGLCSVGWPLGLTTLSVCLIVLTAMGAVTFQGDFNGDLWHGGHRILLGISPYLPHALSAEAAIIRAGGSFTAVAFPRYPPPVLLAAIPFSLLPEHLADGLFCALCIGSVVLAMRYLLEVKDWRCIAIACLSWPVVFGVWLGNLSPLLFFGGAAAWRWRSRIWPLAIAIAAVVVGKLFMWPMAVWLVISRRWRTLAVAAAVTVVVTLAAWAVIGFAGMTAYPHMLSDVATIGEGRGCSLVAALLSIGFSRAAARATAVLCAAVLLIGAWMVLRQPDGERRAFGLSVMAALTACPVAWAHYLVLLYIPVALLSPRLSPIWFVPMLAGLVPGPVSHPHIWAAAPALIAELIIIARLCSPLFGRIPSFARRAMTPINTTTEVSPTVADVHARQELV